MLYLIFLGGEDCHSMCYFLCWGVVGVSGTLLNSFFFGGEVTLYYFFFFDVYGVFF